MTSSLLLCVPYSIVFYCVCVYFSELYSHRSSGTGVVVEVVKNK